MARGTQLSTSGARTVDVPITEAARGFKNAMAVWPYLFPEVMVPARGGRVIKFRAEDFQKLNLVRAPGADVQRIDIGYSSDQYALEQRALEVPVPVEVAEDAAAVPKISMGASAAIKARRIVDLQIEVEAARLATDMANYSATHRVALAGANQWSHPDSTPANAVDKAKAVIRQGVGMDPNTLVVGAEVHDRLRNNPDVVDRVKYVMAPERVEAVNMETLAAYFGVEHYAVGSAMTGEEGAFTHLWGKVAILAFTEKADLADMGAPTFGYNYRLDGYPVAETPYYDERSRSWIYPYVCEDRPVIVGKDAGYIFTNVVE